MALYCGIDLHSNNHVIVVIDEADHRIFERRLGNDLSLTLRALAPYQSELTGVAVESTFYEPCVVKYRKPLSYKFFAFQMLALITFCF